MRKQLLTAFLIFLFLIAGTAFAVLYANGYRLGATNGKLNLAKTGILNASSAPRGATVEINGHPTSATNNTINLTPGQYAVAFKKEGYADWQKNIVINAELVSNADALMFPINPALQSISAVGVEDPVIDPSGSKLAFRIASQSATRNGIYVLDMTSRSFPVLALQSSSTQIANDTTDDFSKAKLAWSPDGQQLLASVSSSLQGVSNYLLKTNTLNDTPQDVTATISTIQSQWKLLRDQKQHARLQGLKPTLQEMISSNFKILSFSPDEDKILYQASTSATLPIIISPRRIGNNLLYENRNIKKGLVYVYDIKEDINMKIPETDAAICLSDETTCTSGITWFPDSDHLVIVHDKKIDIAEKDGSNMTTIYAGPFIEPFVYPWPDGSKLVILTNFNNASNPPTLYTIGLR
jgi:dipeptidyl aminopeptidase/acylaminoacyl peptidase